MSETIGDVLNAMRSDVASRDQNDSIQAAIALVERRLADRLEAAARTAPERVFVGQPVAWGEWDALRAELGLGDE